MRPKNNPLFRCKLCLPAKKDSCRPDPSKKTKFTCPPHLIMKAKLTGEGCDHKEFWEALNYARKEPR